MMKNPQWGFESRHCARKVLVEEAAFQFLKQRSQLRVRLVRVLWSLNCWMNSITDGYSFQTSWRKPTASDGGVRLG